MSRRAKRAATQRDPTAAGASGCTVTVCRGGICGTPKASGLDHAAQLHQLRRDLATDAEVRTSRCLDACEHANVIVIQPSAAGHAAGGRPLWLGLVNDPGAAADITTDGRRPLGEILLFPTGDPGEMELAYAVGVAHRRRHLASRAVQLITAYAYDTLAAARVILRIPRGNTASAAVARAAGFQLTTAPPIHREGARDPLHTWLHHRAEPPHHP
jgi:hypothetical protein